MNNKADKAFVIGGFILFVFAMSLLSYFEYQEQKKTFYERVDANLLAAANGANLILPSDYHDRALETSSISQGEYNHYLNRLSTFAKSIQVVYVYTMVQKNGKIYFTESSATDEERKTGINLTHYFDQYDDASNKLKEVFKTHNISYDEYTDKWGTFRSIFLPLKTSKGNFYVIGADIRIDQINKKIDQKALSLFLRFLGIIAVGTIVLMWKLRQINSRLKKSNELLVEDLKNEREHLHNIIWGTGAGTWEWNIQTGENVVNDEWKQLLGYKADELSPVSYETWEKLTHPDDFAEAHKVLKRHFIGELDYFECEIRMRHKSGDWIWFHAKGKVVAHSNDGKPLWMAGVLLEITRRKEVEGQLRKLSQAVEQSPNSIIITDLEGNIEYANTTFFSATGYTRDEVIGKNPRLFKSGKTPHSTYQEMWRQLRKGESWRGEFINQSKDGIEYIQSVNISPIFHFDGTITHYMAIEEDITEKKRSEERIYYLANFDPLTGLPNRAQLENHFKYILSLAKRSLSTFCVMFIDLDRFKEINDSLGHKIGDELLSESAKRLKSLIRESDIVARLGGDEFIIILSDADLHGAEHVAQKILDVISRPYKIEEYELNISASVGIALYPSDGADIETLSKNADAAMYRSKQDGRNTYRFFTEEMQTQSLRNLQLSNALRNALGNQELFLVYQPQISFQDGRLIGAEALLRWNHPELGSIPPSEFIPVAEENGLILPIGEWVLRTAVKKAKEWLDATQLPLVMSVNLSAVQFRHHDLPNLISRILHEYDLPAHCLELELTEGMAMHDPQLAINIIQNLNLRGVRISIDDFGTGYSSLSYLKQFKINKLKIDQSFVRDLSTDPDDKAIVSAVINMAHSLGLDAIAEGVETIEQLECLRAKGCDEAQGYYYSKPLPAVEFEAFLKTKGLDSVSLH